ncbi:ABC transporter substrate-binding protein [Thalassovita sp.]|uniref:ABC transporter substrate-binding protein n=1 Tax=Thalassovita sp. TaxID=1979401 RepID=UPI0029DE71B6|nr:ABC transporter substrate-binding protein [Thalassovita sp.]
MIRLLLCAAVLLTFPALAAGAEVALHITYLRHEQPRPPVLSNLDPIPDDLGIAGAQLALLDSRTTGKFLGHTYTLDHVSVPEDGDILAAAQTVLAANRLVILDMPGTDMLRIADLPQATGAILFNATDPATTLRDSDCRANLLHTIPSQAMRADALMQFALSKRWTKLALIAGEHPSDIDWAAALDASARKFGLKIGARKTWAFDADMRRNASQEVPLFTQGLKDYDLLLVADELNDFGRYIPYNTWLPRPVAGSVALVPLGWNRVVEQWGAVQLQNRFHDLSGRDMRPRDYAAWAALRALSEAATRTGSSDPSTLRSFLLSDAFELAAFKGRPLSFRAWNGQLRQTIPLVSGDAMVAQAPLDGFLHQRTELDTLGLDQPESKCEAYK